MQETQLHGLLERRTAGRNLIAVRTTSHLMKRDFTATGSNQLSITNITKHRTREGRVFCYAVLDAYSRKAMGWIIGRITDAALANSALNMAAATRSITRETIIHAEHGAQFASWLSPSGVNNNGRKLSLGMVGDCYDNAIMESLWGRMQTELLNRKMEHHR